MKTINRITITCLLMIAFSLMNVSSALAWQEMHSDQAKTVVVTESQVISDDLFIVGKDVIVDGTIDGDLLCFAENITINGTVNGDIFGFCRDMTINGKANDDVRVGAQNIRLGGQVIGSFSAAGNNIYMDNTARVGGNITLALEKAIVLAPIQGSIHSFTRSLEVASPVGRDVTSFTEELTISSGAAIGGKLVYTSNQLAKISDDVKIAGGITHKLPPKTEKHQETAPSPFEGVIWFLVTFASTCLIWFVWRLISPQALDEMEENLNTWPWPVVGWGMLMFFMIPIAAIILLFTVVGMPLSILALIAYGITLYFGKIIVGSWIGHLAAEKSGNQELLNRPNVMAVVGILIVMLLGIVPFLGFWIKWVIGAVGLGCAFLAIREKRTMKNAEV